MFLENLINSLKEKELDKKLNLKVILHSKRANIYYLEKCRVMLKDNRVTYLTSIADTNNFYNIPIANTTVLLLGTGTSITQAAVRYLSSAGVAIGFCGSNGTPLFAGSEIEFINSKSEYRETKYVQNWLSFWYEDSIRLQAAKKFQKNRIDFIKKVWQKDPQIRDKILYPNEALFDENVSKFSKSIEKAINVNELLLSEATFTKKLYSICASSLRIRNFVRDRESLDSINIHLNHGNYLAYGLASVALWVLGIPPAFALFHGKTRRGALVFDVADLIKDAIVLPLAFLSDEDNFNDDSFREKCIEYFSDYSVLDYMINNIKNVCDDYSIKN